MIASTGAGLTGTYLVPSTSIGLTGPLVIGVKRLPLTLIALVIGAGVGGFKGTLKQNTG